MYASFTLKSQLTHPNYYGFETFMSLHSNICIRIYGTIHLRRRHFLGGEGSKIDQICRRLVVKHCRREGDRGQKSWKFANVLNGWSLFQILNTEVRWNALQALKHAVEKKFYIRQGLLHISYWTEQLFWSVRMGGRVANVVAYHDKLLTKWRYI